MMNGDEIAIIGISCRFPGANNLQEFWNNLVQGKESITFLSEQERNDWVAHELSGSPNYVPCRGGVLQNSDQFDASFFGYSPKEAALMDPQIRIFHECTWHALEDAGYLPGIFKGDIGVYASASDNLHWKNNVLFSKENQMRDGLAMSQLIDKDFISSRVAYNLNLTGPCFAVQTACSTSLVAVHLACQAILNGECDLAISGGVSIGYGLENGYLYQEGSILSADGHCKAFDANAKGTIPGSGAGVVVLKLLEHALRDNDSIYAVIKGSAINNDGRQKAGYTSPSIAGQSKAIRAAFKSAAVQPSSIYYVEAHGTGTPLGDPIEMEALKEAFGNSGKQHCGIGSLKSNVGHMDVAAGVAGLIKAALVLKYRKLPPTLNWTAPNPKIDFENSPFYVVDKLKDLGLQTQVLRAGVSSFGIGGTNAHVILEEFKEQSVAGDKSKDQLILISAKTASALDKARQNLYNYLIADEGQSLDDIACTLAIGRSQFSMRMAFVVKDRADLLSKLQGENAQEANNMHSQTDGQKIIFMFSGQGSQYTDMVSALYMNEPVFRAHLDECLRAYKRETGNDLIPLIFSANEAESSRAEDPIHQTRNAQVVLFVIEYAMARTLADWGIQADAMIGHSIGEYVAACLSGVFSLDDGLRIVIKRGELMQSMPPGSMLSVNGNEREVMTVCQKYRVSVAAINSPANYVLSGETENILGAEKELVANGYQAKVLRTSHAFHSEMMESMLQEFQHYLSTFKFNAPAVPFISNLSGEMITPGEAMSPQYWVSHLRQAVNFSKGIDNLLLNYPGGIFVELGPGNTLAALTRRSKVFSNAHHVAGLIKHPQDRENGYTYFLKSLAALWVGGMHIDFLKMYMNKSGRRVHLPGYAFDDHIFNATLEFNSVRDFLSKESTNAGAKSGSIFYMPAWEQVVGHCDRPVEGKSNWLIFLNDNLDIDEISGRLAGYAAHIVFIKRGVGFKKNAENLYVINPDVKEDYFTVINSLHKSNQLPDYVIHTWTAVNDLQMLSVDRIEKYNSLGFYSVIYLAQGIGALGLDRRTDIDIITNNSLPVLGDECQYPEKAILLGASRIVPVEYNTISCRYIDINASVLDSGMLLQCIEKLSSLPGNSCYAVRGNHLWAESYKNIALPEPMHSKSLIKTKGVYLLTGGLGGMALFIARYLADQYQAIVILVGRNTPEQLYDSDTPQNQIKLGILSDIKKSQGTVSFYQADICDKKRMIELVRDCEARYGKINGVLHTAAVADEFGAIQKRKKTDFEDSMRVKVKGTLILHDIFKDKSLDFVVLFSSTGILSPGSKYGEVGYVAANGFLDAMASQNFGAGTTVKTISWCDWSQVGLSVKSIDEFFAHDAELKKTALSAFEKEALTPEQGVHAFAQVMSNKIARTIISTKPVEKMGEKKGVNGWKIKQDLFLKQKKNRAPFEKPVRAGKYIAPVDDIQRKILDIWQDYFGYQGISVHDNIFELGATSLDVSQINESLKSKLKIQIPLVTQFEYPTIDKLSQFIKGSTSVGEEKIVEVKVENVKSKMDKMRTKAKG